MIGVVVRRQIDVVERMPSIVPIVRNDPTWKDDGGDDVVVVVVVVGGGGGGFENDDSRETTSSLKDCPLANVDFH